MAYLRMRGGSGLGDTLYVRPIAEHYLKLGHTITVYTDYPLVFANTEVHVERFQRLRTEVIAHYVGGKGNPTTNQWQDVCMSARVPSNLPFRISWKVRNPSLIKWVTKLADGKPIVIVHGGRIPMGRRDGFGRELLPAKGAFDTVLANLKDCFLVRVGTNEDQVYELRHHLLMNGSSTVSDLLDLASVCSGVVCQCSFAIPLAEVFDKPVLAIWASAGLQSSTAFIRQITPQKVFSSKKSQFVVDTSPAGALRDAANALRFV